MDELENKALWSVRINEKIQLGINIFTGAVRIVIHYVLSVPVALIFAVTCFIEHSLFSFRKVSSRFFADMRVFNSWTRINRIEKILSSIHPTQGE